MLHHCIRVSLSSWPRDRTLLLIGVRAPSDLGGGNLIARKTHSNRGENKNVYNSHV